MKRLVAATLAAIALTPGAPAHAQNAPSRFYVRADAGASIPTGGDLDNFDTSAIVGAGVGMKILPFLRTDLTLSYRPEYSGANNDTTTLPGSTINERSKINSLVGMVNGYYDIITFSGVTPYVGGGVGFARNEVGATTASIAGAEVLSLSGATRTEFAWQVGAGAAIGILPGVALDIAYHYLDAGKFSTGTTATVPGIVAVSVPATTGRLQAHEITAGVRVGF